MRKNLGSKIIAVSLILGIFFLIGYAIYLGSQSGIHQGYEPDQPINFSHKTHAGDNKIQCLYCHFGAETSRHAGIPPVNVCLNCHNKIKTESPEIQKIQRAVAEKKPIEWIKVHNLPDFVYFNHSQHVIAGVSCQSCHGPVESMSRMRQANTLTMGWCIGCHRERGIQPPPGHGDTLPEELDMEKQPRLFESGRDCAKCHY